MKWKEMEKTSGTGKTDDKLDTARNTTVRKTEDKKRITGTGRSGIVPYLRSRAVYQQKECGQEQEDQEWSRAAQQICPDRINEAIIV